MESVKNILAVDRIFRINENPLSDKIKGTALSAFTKDVYFSYDDIQINEVKRMPEKNAWLVNGKYEVSNVPTSKASPINSYFADENEVISIVIALNEGEYKKHEARVEEEKQMMNFLLEAMDADSKALKK